MHPGLPFFARAKKGNRKKARPGAHDCSLRARGAPIHGAPVRRRGSPPDFHEYSVSPSPHRALANSPGAYYAPRAQTRARLKTPDGSAVLGARYGDPKKPNISMPCLTGRLRNRTMPCLLMTYCIKTMFCRLADQIMQHGAPGYVAILKSSL